MTLLINIFQNKNQEKLFLTKHVIAYLLLILPLFIAIVFDLSNMFFLAGILSICTIPIFILFFRFFSNGTMEIDTDFIKLKSESIEKKINIETIESIDIYYSNEYFRAPICIEIRQKKPFKKTKILFDKFYGVNPIKMVNQLKKAIPVKFNEIYVHTDLSLRKK